MRHTFGTLAVAVFPLSDVPAHTGHADVATTMRYMHHVPRVDAAARLGRGSRRVRVSRTVSPTRANQAQLSATRAATMPLSGAG
jgi:integrase